MGFIALFHSGVPGVALWGVWQKTHILVSVSALRSPGPVTERLCFVLLIPVLATVIPGCSRKTPATRPRRTTHLFMRLPHKPLMYHILFVLYLSVTPDSAIISIFASFRSSFSHSLRRFFCAAALNLPSIMPFTSSNVYCFSGT